MDDDSDEPADERDVHFYRYEFQPVSQQVLSSDKPVNRRRSPVIFLSEKTRAQAVHGIFMFLSDSTRVTSSYSIVCDLEIFFQKNAFSVTITVTNQDGCGKRRG